MLDRDHKTPACFCDRLALRDRAKAENIGQISGIQRGHADGPLLRPPSVKSAYQRLVADSDCPRRTRSQITARQYRRF